jgi:cardiolipin synthase A/B
MRLPALQAGHNVRLLQGGQEFFPALVQAIDQSRHEVRLETYIFNVEKSGQGVVDALMRAATRGVSVYVVVDGAGTPNLPPALVAQLDAAGVQWHIYSRLAGLGWLVPHRWRRLHRKLCVVDGAIAFCGGINVLDDFFDPNYGVLNAPRFDFAVRVTGPLVRDATQSMTQFWWRLKAATEARERDFPAAWSALQSAVRLSLAQRGAAGVQGHESPAVVQAGESPRATRDHSARAALLLRDNLRRRTQIERAYRKAIGEARSEIIIASAYFVPGGRLRRALIHAARRGVRVRLLLQGRYEYFMQFHAARPVFGALLAAGIEIHEYAPSFLHAKVAVIDSLWATVGSSNLDPLSLLLAREANVVVLDAPFAHDLRQRLEQAMQTQGQQMDPKTYASRPLYQRFLDMLAFGLMRFMLFLSGNRY